MGIVTRAACTAVATGVMVAGSAPSAQRGQPLPPPTIKEGVTQKIADHVYVIPDFELQGRINRNQMASVVRAAYNEAQ